MFPINAFVSVKIMIEKANVMKNKINANFIVLIAFLLCCFREIKFNWLD